MPSIPAYKNCKGLFGDSKEDILRFYNLVDSPMNRLEEMVFAERLSRLTGIDYVKKLNEDFKKRDENLQKFLQSDEYPDK